MRNWRRGFNLYWALTIVVVSASVMYTFWNPNNIFGESKALNLWGISVRTFESQETVLQFVGALVVVLGFLGTLHGREYINRLTVSGIIGALLAMVGLVLQIIKANPDSLIVLGFMLFYLILIWVSPVTALIAREVKRAHP